MKRLLLVVFLLLFSTWAFAQEPGDLQVEFSYEPADPAYTAVGYKFFADNNLICQTSDVEAGPPQVFYCDASALSPGSYNFTMSAVWADGESPQSAPFAFEIPLPDPTSPQILIIRFL